MTNESSPRLCINCRWIATNGSGNAEKFRCLAPQNKQGIDLVTGSPLWIHENCYSARAASEGPYTCSEPGGWFEDKPPPPPERGLDGWPANQPAGYSKKPNVDSLLAELGS